MAIFISKKINGSDSKAQNRVRSPFELPKGWRWKVGDKVECDRIGDGPRPRAEFDIPYNPMPFLGINW